ncbi:MAG: trigger factor [Actinomycetota bacterium]
MKSTVEPLEGNKVKLVVELDEEEFEKDLDAAFARLAREVRLPGFRPGKAPRKVLEARIGQEYARGEAFREALPNYYSEAVKEHEVDVIAPPEIDITAGEEQGAVAFDAVVEVRPSVEVSGYDSLTVEVPKLEVDDDDVDEAVDRMRKQFSELETVERAAAEGDQVVIDIAAVHEGEPVPGMTTDGYNYEVGSGATGIDEIDEQLTGASAGDELEFSADHPDDDEDEPLQFSITVSEVQERVLPEPTDEWVSQNSEFDNIDELRADYRSRMTETRLSQARSARQNKLAELVAELVDDDDVPTAMVENETENRLQDMAMRLQAQGIEFEQYLQFTGQDPATVMDEMRTQAQVTAKLDLALRAIAAQESISATDDELDSELETVAERFERSVADVRAELAEAGQLPAVRADLVKTKTMDWLIERAEVVDEDGQPVSADALEMPDDPDDAEAEGSDPADPAADAEADADLSTDADEAAADEAADASEEE